MMLGRVYPVFNGFRGSHGSVALAVAIALFVLPESGLVLVSDADLWGEGYRKSKS